MIKLCVFDLDSTLMDREAIDILARVYDKEEEVMDITHHAMVDELGFFESLQERVSFLKEMSYGPVLKIGQDLPLVNGAYRLIEFLDSKSILVVTSSGGFHEDIDSTMKKLEVDLGSASCLHYRDNTLSGLVDGEIMLSNSEGLMPQRLKSSLNLQTHEVTRVGDGTDDIAVLNESGLKVTFRAKEILRSKADTYADNKDLKEIIRVV